MIQLTKMKENLMSIVMDYFIQESSICKDVCMYGNQWKSMDAGNCRKNTFHFLKYKMVSCGVKNMWFLVTELKYAKPLYPLCNSGIFHSHLLITYSTHYFLSTAPMSGVLFALQLIEAQKIRPGVHLQSAGSQRMVFVVVPPHWELHKLTASLGWGLSTAVE